MKFCSPRAVDAPVNWMAAPSSRSFDRPIACVAAAADGRLAVGLDGCGRRPRANADGRLAIVLAAHGGLRRRRSPSLRDALIVCRRLGAIMRPINGSAT